MPSYVITGVSKGLGWEFLTQVSANPNNQVFGIVRNKSPTEQRVTEELSDRSNITLLQADIVKYDELKTAVVVVANTTGGSLDYLFANAAYLTSFDAYDGIGILGQRPQEMSNEFHALMETNVLANIHLYNLFMPLILEGNAKKVVAITSGVADIDWTNNYELEAMSLYATSKAAMNMVTAKFNAQYKRDGVLFLSICPGLVDVEHNRDQPGSAEQLVKMQQMFAKFKEYSPTFEGLTPPEKAVGAVLWVTDNSTIEEGDGGRFLSHFKNRQWL